MTDRTLSIPGDFESLFAFTKLLSESNLKINNLWQDDQGEWVCSLRDDEYGYEFGRGTTWRVACARAHDMFRLEQKDPLIFGKTRAYAETPAKGVSLEDLGL